MDNILHIGQAARRLGVTPHYLRLLESRGRIPPARRDQRGDRIYTDGDLALLGAMGIGARPRRLRSAAEVLGAPS